MINANMRSYDYYTYSDVNSYGQPQLSKDVQGSVKMAIYTTSQNIVANPLYQNASFLGLTNDASISDKYVIQYGALKLKVLYINTQGNLKQVYMAKVK